MSGNCKLQTAHTTNWLLSFIPAGMVRPRLAAMTIVRLVNSKRVNQAMLALTVCQRKRENTMHHHLNSRYIFSACYFTNVAVGSLR